MVTLYSTKLSANGRKPLALAEHLGLDLALREVNVYAGGGRDPAYLSINPSGQIPALVDGEFVLTESNAILVHLAETHGADALWPRDVRTRADILRWLFWEASQWQPALIAALSAHVGHLLLPAVVPAPESAPDWAEARPAARLGELEARLHGCAFLCGAGPSLADFAVGGMTTYFARTGFPAHRFPGIAAWLDRLEAMPAWRATATAPWSDVAGAL